MIVQKKLVLISLWLIGDQRKLVLEGYYFNACFLPYRDKERDFDFLSSLELVIVDQADVFLMQNWEHVQHLFDHTHLQPKESHGVDFSRVRMWSLNGWNKFYRQTLIFCDFLTPEINSLFSSHCNSILTLNVPVLKV